MFTKDLFLSNIIHKSVQLCVSEQMIHPPHTCGISRCWRDSRIRAQAAHDIGHFKMKIDGIGGERKPVRVQCDRLLPHAVKHISNELIRLVAVTCGMLFILLQRLCKEEWATFQSHRILAGTEMRRHIRWSAVNADRPPPPPFLCLDYF